MASISRELFVTFEGIENASLIDGYRASAWCPALAGEAAELRSGDGEHGLLAAALPAGRGGAKFGGARHIVACVLKVSVSAAFSVGSISANLVTFHEIRIGFMELQQRFPLHSSKDPLLDALLCNF